jgi:hypothetical protein
MTHEVVVRPDGCLYRAKKSPWAQVLGSAWGESTSVIVWRTHDRDLAMALAGDAWRRETGGESLPGDMTVGWFKSVPWDSCGYYDYSVIEVRHNRHGAAPGVEFRSEGSYHC